ncbi:hypothetical protein L0244_38190 [bacterium]|nr:hypothetical protein [bacterium]
MRRRGIDAMRVQDCGLSGASEQFNRKARRVRRFYSSQRSPRTLRLVFGSLHWSRWTSHSINVLRSLIRRSTGSRFFDP